MSSTILSGGNALEVAWSVAKPLLTKLGGAGAVGVVVGVALKRLFRWVAVCLGLAFLALQLLSHLGFITVHWSHMEQTATQLLDSNADGKLDDQDLQYYFNGLGLLTAGLPNVGGFTAGLLLGFRI